MIIKSHQTVQKVCPWCSRNVRVAILIDADSGKHELEPVSAHGCGSEDFYSTKSRARVDRIAREGTRA